VICRCGYDHDSVRDTNLFLRNCWFSRLARLRRIYERISPDFV